MVVKDKDIPITIRKKKWLRFKKNSLDLILLFIRETINDKINDIVKYFSKINKSMNLSFEVRKNTNTENTIKNKKLSKNIFFLSFKN